MLMEPCYTPSLAWVCLACGQLAPYHAAPTDWIDSAAAMDLPVSSQTPYALHDVPPMAMAARGGDVHDAPTGGLWQSPELQQRQRSHHERESAGNSRSDSGDDTHSLHHRHRRSPHDQRSPSRDGAHSCLNNESDSYLSMAAVSHHHSQRKQQQQQWKKGGQETLFSASGHAQHSAATREEALPTRSTLSAYELDHGRCKGNRYARRAAGGNVVDPAQSLAALLMEEHLVGSREMRYCESCHEVRCAEIRKLGDAMPHASATTATPCPAREEQQNMMESANAARRSPTPSSHVHGVGASTSFLYAYDSPYNNNNNTSSSTAAEMVNDPLLHTVNADDAPRSPSNSFASATRGNFHRTREIPSVHLVVAQSVARMVVKLKNAAVTVLANFHPLSPSLPTARRRHADDDVHNRGEARAMDTPRGDTDSSRSGRYTLHSDGDSCPPSRTSHKRTTKTQPGNFLFSPNSSLDEAVTLGGGESNGISYNSFATATSQQPQHQPWCSPAGTSAGDDQPFSSAERGSAQQASPIGMPAHAQLLFPDGGRGPTPPPANTGAGAPAAAAGSAATLRMCKEKWNAYNVTEALWRLVLPSFSAPFLTSAVAAAGPSSSRSNSALSTPLRGGGGVGASGFDAQPRPYRGFRGEVEDAVGKLDSMQLEVAKLRMEQVLAAVAAEQARRARDGEEGR